MVADSLCFKALTVQGIKTAYMESDKQMNADILTTIYQDNEKYTFKSESGTQTLFLKNATWGIYLCDRCGEQTTSLNIKGTHPIETYNQNCNSWWIFDRKHRGIYRLKKIVG